MQEIGFLLLKLSASSIYLLKIIKMVRLMVCHGLILEQQANNHLPFLELVDDVSCNEHSREQNNENVEFRCRMHNF